MASKKSKGCTVNGGTPAEALAILLRKKYRVTDCFPEYPMRAWITEFGYDNSAAYIDCDVDEIWLARELYTAGILPDTLKALPPGLVYSVVHQGEPVDSIFHAVASILDTTGDLT